ncbi:MAG: hypothetical protein M1827_002498 [Pycnora praestabilis]|nr:MAG: hypothetical protein M1827_002498 [Pycnora praestabilis]
MPPRLLQLPNSIRILPNLRLLSTYGSLGGDDGSSLQNRKCIVTGASRGIGLSIAKCFAKAGASCVLVGRNTYSLEKAVSGLLQDDEGDRKHCVRVGDVGDRMFWETLGKEMADVDILVNAAGMTHSSLLMATKSELVKKVIQTNLMGTIWGCQIMSKHMLRRKAADSCVINVSSLLGVKGGKGSAAYAASKAGILGLTRSLAAELGQANVRVNAIVPGYIETQMTETNVQVKDMTAEARSQALESIPMRRFGKDEEIANAALFLAKNPYANNCVLNLDGGLSAT